MGSALTGSDGGKRALRHPEANHTEKHSGPTPAWHEDQEPVEPRTAQEVPLALRTPGLEENVCLHNKDTLMSVSNFSLGLIN